MTLDDFKVGFAELRERGFVKSLRRGPTGVGYTLETILGITENNIALSDLDDAELKSTRSDSSSMITLFTYDRKAWVMPPLEAVRKYGTPDKGPKNKGRIGMYFTMSTKPNVSGLYLDIDDDYMTIKHIDGDVVAVWSIKRLAEKFAQKFPSLLLVSADSRLINGDEHFHFNRAMVLSGTSPELFRKQLIAGNVLVDLRLHDKITRARNHGTGFRAYERSLPKLFPNCREL